MGISQKPRCQILPAHEHSYDMKRKSWIYPRPSSDSSDNTWFWKLAAVYILSVASDDRCDMKRNIWVATRGIKQWFLTQQALLFIYYSYLFYFLFCLWVQSLESRVHSWFYTMPFRLAHNGSNLPKGYPRKYVYFAGALLSTHPFLVSVSYDLKFKVIVSQFFFEAGVFCV